ncbi:MAG: hypothetical protein IPJ18_20175 [Betaproteobacteria bacterium]|nr:hypothetical protein [Betaproteobacteria bacterium]
MMWIRSSLTENIQGPHLNLASKDQLPFMPARTLGDRILVSIVEMADYPGSNLLTKGAAKEVVQPIEEKKKVGRPRGSTKARLEIPAFQSAQNRNLQVRIQLHIDRLAVIRRKVGPLTDDATLTCAEKFESAKSSMRHSVGLAQSQFSEVELSLEIPLAATTNADLGTTRRKL